MTLFAGNSFLKQDGSEHDAQSVIDSLGVLLVYFSAHWCPSCRGFTTILQNFYEEVEDAAEILFVSSDKDPAEAMSYFKAHGETSTYLLLTGSFSTLT